MTPLTIYAVVERRHFLGAVALVNSLRLQGHTEEIVLLDCGLDERQRRLLSSEASIITADLKTAPHLLKAAAPLRRPSDLMLLIDVDIVVTQSLRPLVDRAASGKIVAFADRLSGRFDSRWQDILRLDRPVRRHVYLNSGLVVLPRDAGLRLLRRLDECTEFADTERSLFGSGSPHDPLYFLDQDILNALLGAEFASDDVHVLPHRLAPHPPFAGIRIDDRRTLACSYANGDRPYVLHHIQRKPWLSAMSSNVYSRLLPRLLLDPDVRIRLSPSDVPLRVQNGPRAGLARRVDSVLDAVTQARRTLGLRRGSVAGAAPPTS